MRSDTSLFSFFLLSIINFLLLLNLSEVDAIIQFILLPIIYDFTGWLDQGRYFNIQEALLVPRTVLSTMVHTIILRWVVRLVPHKADLAEVLVLKTQLIEVVEGLHVRYLLRIQELVWLTHTGIEHVIRLSNLMGVVF